MINSSCDFSGISKWFRAKASENFVPQILVGAKLGHRLVVSLYVRWLVYC